MTVSIPLGWAIAALLIAWVVLTVCLIDLFEGVIDRAAERHLKRVRDRSAPPGSEGT